MDKHRKPSESDSLSYVNQSTMAPDIKHLMSARGFGELCGPRTGVTRVLFARYWRRVTCPECRARLPWWKRLALRLCRGKEA